MDSKKPLPPAALSPVLLADFRQRAEAIIARERGFTPACLVKLGGLARQLGFAEDQIEDALRSLGAEAIPPPAPPNPQVEKFRRRLTKDLQGKTRSILGPTIEARIVEAAQRKYSISEATAREVFAQVAAALSLRRISADEAVRNMTESIDQAAADSTWLAKESRDRLRSAGLNWGLELEVVDALIEE